MSRKIKYYSKLNPSVKKGVLDKIYHNGNELIDVQWKGESIKAILMMEDVDEWLVIIDDNKLLKKSEVQEDDEEDDDEMNYDAEDTQFGVEENEEE